MGSDRERLKELMAARPADFTAVRARLARAGTPDLAKVRKPPLKLWAANRALAARRDAGERLAAATRKLQEIEHSIARGQKDAGADLRAAAADQRRELDVLESEARSQLTAIGSPPSAAVEARDIIRSAVLAHGQAWSDLAEGMLTEAPTEEPGAVFGVSTEDLPRPPREKSVLAAEASRRLREEARGLRAEANRLREEAHRLEGEARRARQLADRADARASQAESKA